MKPSHLVTPRKLSECHWDYEADPIDKMNKEIMSIRCHVVILFIAAVVIAADVFFWRAN